MFENLVEMSLHPIVGAVNFLAQMRKLFVKHARANVILDMLRDRTSAKHMWLNGVNDFRIENLDGARRCRCLPLELPWLDLPWRGRLGPLGLRGRGLRGRGLGFRPLLLLGSSLSRSPQEFFDVAGHVVGYL